MPRHRRVRSGAVLALSACALGCGSARHPLAADGAAAGGRDRSSAAGACETPASGGQLETYDNITQIGTAARRVFRGAGDRPVATIYYRSTESRIVGPFAEERLVVQSIRLHSYDEDGRETRTVTCDGSRTVAGIHEIYYRPDGTVERELERSGDGRLVWEVRGATRLTYDDSGRRLVSIDGLVREGVELAQGWGPAVGGLSWGIAASRTDGEPGRITIYGTVRNEGAADASVIAGLPQFVLSLELRDERGALVAQDSPRLERRRAELLQMNGGRAESVKSLRPGEAAALDTTFLSDWYSGLPAGRYRLAGRRRTSDEEPALASNVIEIEIR